MTHKEAIETLKKILPEKPAYNAVFHVWAFRKRARHQVTINGLSQKMKLEGFNFPRQHYADLLKTLADLGFGKLELSSKGSIVALKEVKVTLQSIGQAMCGGQDTLDKYRRRNQYTSVKTPLAEEPRLIKKKNEGSSVILTFVVNGKAINIPVTRDLTPSDIGILIERFQEKGKE